MWQEFYKINIESKEYPSLLKKIPDRPQQLFVKGKLSAQEPYFAIVGARRCSNYGREVTMMLAGDLARAGLTIVSGLAPGVDTIAHKAALEDGGRTVAVLGTGLDEASIYPKENIPLARKIVSQGGVLISEYPVGTHGSKMTFPHRNRIIAGMSLGVLVVEAKVKSGSLITANLAKKFGRKVFAVPGPITSANSKGTHLLLRQGAIVAESAHDILSALGLENIGTTKRSTKIGNEKSIEVVILNTLTQGSLHIDDIIDKSGLSPSQVAAALNILEINGIVKNLGGNVYAAKRGKPFILTF